MAGCILVVSDDPELQEEMRFGVAGDDEIAFANDALAARNVFATTTPVAVVVDLRTGNAGGFALTRDMSQDPRLRSIPVVILIAREQDRWLAKTAGAAAVLRKPVGGPQLAAAISSLLTAERPA
ncbi:MAG TPA: response regulator [Actinomycetota bacterium]|nr:response regulator [Actinomycetota bacterium]